MHGSSNDIIMVTTPWQQLMEHFGVSGSLDPTAPSNFAQTLVLRLCDRDGDFGADGVYFLDIDEHGHVDANFYNPDGSFAGMCGNGLRAVTRLVNDHLAEKPDQVVITSDGSPFVGSDTDLFVGIEEATISTRSISFATQDLPMNVNSPEFVESKIEASGTSLAFTALAIPNNHLVAMVDEFDLDQLKYVGEKLTIPNELIPNGANISFVVELPDVDGRKEFFVRTFERGAGLTASCGSGQTASRAVLTKAGIISGLEPVLLRNVGGPAYVELKESDERYFGLLTGNANYVYTAEVELLPDGTFNSVSGPDTNKDEIDQFKDLFEDNKKLIEKAGIEADFESAEKAFHV